VRILKNKVKEMRFFKEGMTQQELAREVDVTRQTIISIEKGKFNPSVKLALNIAEFFGKPVEEIFYLEEEC
jgi:putative transcriptional regulator